ncbi:MAG: response regulator [Rhodospirillales bacterium]
MSAPVRVLIVEDSEDDAMLVLREMARRGHRTEHRIVDTAEALAAALAGGRWDLVIADFTLPQFSGARALEMVRARDTEVPFIFVSGSIGEDTAVAAMKAGAQDYIIKGNLARLVPAIERELKDAAARQAKLSAETGRRTAEARFRQILALAADAIVALDEDRRITVFNAAAERLFGLAAADAIGQGVGLLVPERLAADYGALFDSFAASPETAWNMNEIGDVVGRRSDGGEFPAEVSMSKLVEDGRTAYTLIVRDITARKELERQLQQSHRLEAVGQLSGGMAHDFNNLLTIIIGNVELAMGQPELAPETHLNLDQALHAGLRGATLIRKLLAFARRQSLHASAFDLNRLVSEATDLLWRTLGEEIQVSVQLADELAAAFADPAQVESALVNLAINARDAMPNGGRLTIETANAVLDEEYAAQNLDVAPGAYVMLAVSDTGTGMPQDVLARVFEPFFTTKGENKGTGLGLSMIYGFARQSRGHVKIYSEVGHGTTVRLYLPVAEMRPAAATPAAASVDEAPAGATILVVEDNNEVRMVTVAILKSLGYTVVEADTGPAALEVLRGPAAIDLLYTDVIMPGGMTGVALAREARALRPALPVLFTSGFAGAQIQEIAGPDKVEDFLTKPVRRRDLAQKIREIFARNGG